MPDMDRLRLAQVAGPNVAEVPDSFAGVVSFGSLNLVQEVTLCPIKLSRVKTARKASEVQSNFQTAL